MCPLSRCVIARSSRQAWFGHVDRDRCDLPVTVAIAILALVTAAALAAVAVGVAGSLAGLPTVATGLGAWSAFAVTFGAGLPITCWKPGTSTRDFTRWGPASA
jgi:hypothetical protein